MSELRTVHEDGTITVVPLTHASCRPLLDSWTAQADAWEDYCRSRLSPAPDPLEDGNRTP